MPELKRTIIAQGESVNLSPAIVSSCAEDLVAYCAGFESNKDDYGCLQVGFIRFPRVGFIRSPRVGFIRSPSVGFISFPRVVILTY